MTRQGEVGAIAEAAGTGNHDGRSLDNGAALPGFMPGRLPENAPAADFDAVAVAKALLRAMRAGALGTIDRNTGHPFGSLVNVATDVDGSPLILISRPGHPYRQSGEGRPRVAAACIRRPGRPAGPSAPDGIGHLRADRASGRCRAAAAPALSGASSEVRAVCGLRGFFVLATERRVGASQCRLRPRRRLESG